MTTKSAVGGRPAKAPERKRSATICVRFLPGEADIICSLALEQDVSVSDVVRSLTRRQLAGIRRLPTRT